MFLAKTGRFEESVRRLRKRKRAWRRDADAGWMTSMEAACVDTSSLCHRGAQQLQAGICVPM